MRPLLVSLTSILSFGLASFSFAEPAPGASARREPGVSYKAYMASAALFSNGAVLESQLSPMGTSQHFAQATLEDATPWESEKVMMERFQQFRDLRFTAAPSRPDFPRRSSWMYPDDGCFARAALAVRNLQQMNYPAPKKVFAFGDLQVHTDNAEDGSVSWWYHVAPIVQVGTQKYVLDPAISPRRPLKLEEWLAQMSPDPDSIQVAICESGTYTPGDDCSRPTDGTEAAAESDQGWFLEYEWERIQSLGRDAERELGEFPPWLERQSSVLH